ncbi:MAG: 2-isopropylmalate synthase [Chloroflexi bacterium]|nr:MAG: 2-isopropylmalate synthase [Chloroflexota bacterium]
MDRVLIFDTTLRDGEQSPGFSMNTGEKLELAKQLAALGVDIIEAGFPISSPGDLEAVQQIARSVRGPVIAGLARANKLDVDAAWQGVKDAARPRIHTFIATSEIHMKHKLRLTPNEVLEAAGEAVAYAKGFCNDVEFSAEDATRSDPEFLTSIFEIAIAAGATTINVPDTVGYTTPEEFAALIHHLKAHVPNIDRAVVSVHCHNDLGLAVANSLAGVGAGARQIECTINGIGERAGNASLEEIVMAMHTRKNFYAYESTIATTEIYPTSRLLGTLTGIKVQPNKAIVGANAFAHEAGIHQDGMLKNPLTYEIMRPETIGLPESQLVLGKHSGRHAFRARLNALGYDLSKAQLDDAFVRFKQLCDRKKTIGDADLEALVGDEITKAHEYYKLEALQVSCGFPVTPRANVTLRGPDGATHSAEASGDGPVDAAYQAIAQIVGKQNRLTDFSIHAVTPGRDALGRVSVRVQNGAREAMGHGADTDIIVASAKAYVNALNKLMAGPIA